MAADASSSTDPFDGVNGLIASGRHDDAMLLCACGETAARRRLAGCVANHAAPETVAAAHLEVSTWAHKLATIMVLAGRYDAAKSLCERHLSTSPLGSSQFAPLLMQCLAALKDFRRCNQLIQQHPSTIAHSVEAVVAYGRSRLFSNSNTACDMLVHALSLDPFSSAAFDTIVEGWLLPPVKQIELVRSLKSVTARDPLQLKQVQACYLARVRYAGYIPEVDDDWQAAGGGSLTTFDVPVDDDRHYSGLTVVIPDSLRMYRKAFVSHARGDLKTAELACRAALEASSGLHRDTVTLLLHILTELHAAPSLFELAHRTLQQSPGTAIAAYAVGCYYASVAKVDRAGRYFIRASELDPLFAPALVAYGHCFARLEETEKALDVYRRGSSAFPGLTMLPVYVGMQYARGHTLPLAFNFFEEARLAMSAAVSPTPSDHASVATTQAYAPWNEIGVLQYHLKQYPDAIHSFLRALRCYFVSRLPALAVAGMPSDDGLDPGALDEWQSHDTGGEASAASSGISEYYDCILFNLASAFRKLGRHRDALRYYRRYNRLRPNSVAALGAIGLTYHLMGDVRAAIEAYHAALSVRADGSCRDFLDKALNELYVSSSLDITSWGASSMGNHAAAGPVDPRGPSVGHAGGGERWAVSPTAMPGIGLGLSGLSEIVSESASAANGRHTAATTGGAQSHRTTVGERDASSPLGSHTNRSLLFGHDEEDHTPS